MMAILGLGLKPGDVSTMELGVEKILLAKVGITSLPVKTLLMKILCP